jgi:hypothetical protein
MRGSDRLTDDACFARVLAAFAGERYPLDAGASKVMNFMLHDCSGCDATITPHDFAINFGWNYGPHHYFMATAPAIASWLLDAVGVRGEREVRGRIAAARIPAIPPFFAWELPALHVALVAGLTEVTIRVRDSEAALATPLPEPDRTPKFATLAQPCAHCLQVPERYRVLGDGSLVCLACGRSQ